MNVVDMHVHKALSRAKKLVRRAINCGDRMALHNAIQLLNLIAPE